MLTFTLAKTQDGGCDADHAGPASHVAEKQDPPRGLPFVTGMGDLGRDDNAHDRPEHKRPAGLNLRAVRWTVWD